MRRSATASSSTHLVRIQTESRRAATRKKANENENENGKNA